MEIDHNLLVFLAKTLGLFYFIAMSVVVVIYVYWPSNSEQFDRAAHSIIDNGDKK